MRNESDYQTDYQTALDAWNDEVTERIKAAVERDAARRTLQSIADVLGRPDSKKLVQDVRELREAAQAFRNLNICYRLGKSPSEALFKRLKKAREALRSD